MDLNSSSEVKAAAVVCAGDGVDCDALDARLSRSWLKIGIAAVFAGQGMVFSLAMNMTPPEYGSPAYWIVHAGLILSALVVMGFLGGPLFRSTFGMLRSRRLSIEGLFTLSLTGAFVGSLVSTLTGKGGVFYEIVSIVIAIYTVGRLLSERSQTNLVMESERLREHFDHAWVIDPDAEGGAAHMPVSEITAGARVRVEPGAPFTVDGRVCAGVGYVRETALTGEPVPVVRRPGDWVRAGTWSEDGLFEVETVAGAGEREMDRILQTVEDASGQPSEMQTQANDLIQGFLPLVAGASAATAIYWSFMGTWEAAVLNSMAVLLVACPCALGLATPVAIWQGLFRLAQKGLVSRDGALIDALARTRHLFFDKTGTLSESRMRVTECLVETAWSERRNLLMAMVAAVEARLNHPIARALVDYAGDPGAAPDCDVDTLRTVPGQGVAADLRTSGGDRFSVQVGEAALCETASGVVREQVLELKERGGKRVFVFVEERLAAIFVLRERPRPALGSIWEAFRGQGIQVSVLTGDPDPELPLPAEVEIAAGLSAEQKEQRIRESRTAGEFPIFVGDGVNDASAMARSVASIAMGSGTDLTRAAASGQLPNDQLEALPEAIALARDIHKRLRGNLIYAFCYNVVGMLVAAAGWLHPIFAAVLMLVSSFFVTARALRKPARYNEN